MRKVVHVYNKKTSEHKYYGSLVAAKKGEESLPFHTLGRFKGEVWENKEYIVRFGRLVPSRFRSGEERIVESNVESAIVGKTVVSDSTPSQECCELPTHAKGALKYLGNDTYKNIQEKVNYDKLLSSGMFWEVHPELSGNWDVDREVVQYCH